LRAFVRQSNNFIDNPGCKAYVQGHRSLHGRLGEKKVK